MAAWTSDERFLLKMLGALMCIGVTLVALNHYGYVRLGWLVADVPAAATRAQPYD